MKRTLLVSDPSPKRQITTAPFFLPNDCIAIMFSYCTTITILCCGLVCHSWREIIETDMHAWNSQSFPLRWVMWGKAMLKSYSALATTQTITNFLSGFEIAKWEIQRVVFNEQVQKQMNQFRKHFNVKVKITTPKFIIHQQTTTLLVKIKISSSVVYFRYIYSGSRNFCIDYAFTPTDNPISFCSSYDLDGYLNVYKQISSWPGVLTTFTSDVFMEMVFRFYMLDSWQLVIDHVNERISNNWKSPDEIYRDTLRYEPSWVFNRITCLMPHYR